MLRKFPLDPYGIATAFRTRWDFNSFVISAEEAELFRADALRQRIERLTNAFSGLSQAVERRQRNMRNAAVATWLLSHSRAARPVFASSPLNTMHLAAVQSTLWTDSLTLEQDLNLYDPLRGALNDSIEDQKSGKDYYRQLIRDPGDTGRFAITVSDMDIHPRATSAIMLLRMPPLEALKATLETEALIHQQEKRNTLSAFAPPPPDPGPRFQALIDPDTPMPADVGSVRSRVPEQPVLAPPEPRGTVVTTAANAGITAAANGTVAFAGEFRGYGNTIILQHGADVFSVYSSLGSISVVERQPVKQGEIIGRAGTTGLQSSGIHFQVRRGTETAELSLVLGERPVSTLAVQ